MPSPVTSLKNIGPARQARLIHVNAFGPFNLKIDWRGVPQPRSEVVEMNAPKTKAISKTTAPGNADYIISVDDRAAAGMALRDRV
jgi:hypothetical protein